MWMSLIMVEWRGSEDVGLVWAMGDGIGAEGD